MNFLQQLAYWHWLVAGMVLVILEVFVPGAVLIWFGVSALVVGVLVLVFPGIAGGLQLVLFALLAVAATFGWRAYSKRHPDKDEYPTLNRRGEQYVDRTFTLDDAIENGLGKVRVDDSSWKVQGPDLPAGSRVRVTGVNGTVLIVEGIEQ